MRPCAVLLVANRGSFLVADRAPTMEAFEHLVVVVVWPLASAPRREVSRFVREREQFAEGRSGFLSVLSENTNDRPVVRQIWIPSRVKGPRDRRVAGPSTAKLDIRSFAFARRYRRTRSRLARVRSPNQSVSFLASVSATPHFNFSPRSGCGIFRSGFTFTACACPPTGFV